MFELRQDEHVFWKSMNISRLWSLYSAYYRPRHRQEASQSLQKGENEEISLSAYLTGR